VDTGRLETLRANPLMASAAGGENTALSRNLAAPGDTLAKAAKSASALKTLTGKTGEADLGKSLTTALEAIVTRLSDPPARMTAEEASQLFNYGAELSATTLTAYRSRTADLAESSPLVSAMTEFAKALPALRRKALTRKLAADAATITELKSVAGDTTKPIAAKTARTLVEAFNP
jgi:hypothetical protein